MADFPSSDVRLQFINANAVPGALLRIDEEKREIQRAVHRHMRVFDAPAARFSDVVNALRVNNPHIVHFSGHGSPSKEIMLLNEKGAAEGIDRQALGDLFAFHKSTIRLVVLNTCFSERQAEVVSEHIDAVIFVSQAIGDQAALCYSQELYRAFSDGATVGEAHLQACLILHNAQVPDDRHPQLKTRRKGAEWRPVPNDRPLLDEFRRERKSRFDRDCERYGIRAEAFTVTKYCQADGFSRLEYQISGLTVEDDSILEGVCFSLDSQAGIVHDPVPDAQAEALSICWDPDPAPPPASLRDVIREYSCVRGVFRFAQKLKRKRGPFTFGWTIEAHNMDATTVWEFNHLYTTDRSRRHVDGSRLKPPREYVAHLVWMPMARLNIRVLLPQGVPGAPRFRYFGMQNDRVIPKDEIVSGHILRCFPRNDCSQISGPNSWEANFRYEQNEKAALSHDAANGSELSVEYPVLGSWYALEWPLQNPRILGDARRLMTEAEVIRKRLLEHRAAYLAESANESAAAEIPLLFRNLHEKLRERFGPPGRGEHFETSLLTYDTETSRLVIAEGFVNDVRRAPASIKDFELPFGMGLAGACFRSGTGAVTYARAMENQDTKTPDSYLPSPGATPHEYLMAFPIDHPRLTRQMANQRDIQRCRQLIGVLTIGSTYKASALQEFCVDPPAETAEWERWRDNLRTLRDDCQNECDRLSDFLLGGSRTRATLVGSD